MSHLERLKQEKQIRETAEADELKVKMLIIEINKLHNLHNGRFLDALKTFIKKLQITKMVYIFIVKVEFTI